ncbi:MAG: DUF3035 domain-containing protein [Rhodospirillaceae bacterium]|jgi:hypothetical protein|nr:DUF3035 domain-containing protein [Rhodospirillaceae bacterium]MBT6117869.1 DUF3035 domain-containing protein [Rhodospirillaceae bacterium]
MDHAKTIRLGAALAAVLILGACQSVTDIQEAIAGGDPEDEALYGGVKGPTLALPPEYNLRPPASGSDSRVAAQAARKRVFSLPTSQPVTRPDGTVVASVPGRPSAGEQALLERAGIASVNPTIREDIDAESVSLERSQEQFTDKLRKWNKDAPAGDEEAEVVGAEGTIVEEEAVEEVPPVVIRKKEGLLQSVF